LFIEGLMIIRYFLFISLVTLLSAATTPIEQTAIESGLRQLALHHEQVKQIHPLIKKLQPVAVALNDSLYIYDISGDSVGYHFVKAVEQPFPIAIGTRAAFPLMSYKQKAVVVITPEAFDKKSEFAVVFHEFVHCAQWQTVEMSLKNNLQVYQTAMENQQYSWEIDYAFPYADQNYVENYAAFFRAAEAKDTATVRITRQKLHRTLSPQAYEYLCWQEWKEGTARRIENRIRRLCGLEANHYSRELPFSRVSFYHGGELLIASLILQQPDLEDDPSRLFQVMLDLGKAQ